MIKYIPEKKFKENDVRELLEISNKHNQFTNNGPVKYMLEQEIKKRLNIPGKCVICLSSGTAAIHTLLNYLPDKEFVSSPFTFPAVALGDRVEISDDPGDKNLIVTNLFGTNCIKNHNDRIVIYDNCSSPINLCQHGDYCCGSFHHTKYWGVGEGGFIVAPEDEYFAINALTNFGFDFERRYKTNSFNYKMSDISAAYILSHIRNYDIQKHIEVQKKMVGLFGDLVFNYSDGIVYGCMPLVFDSPKSINELRGFGIEAQKYYKPLNDLKEAQDLYERIIILSLHMDLTDYDIEYMYSCIMRIKK